ncbi:MAG: DNA-3-methyladenine glycosylase [Parachlamydiaceae bacterium]|nr:DNA-3-methyladenine glycosylase [Parachlamydiaceae bacterium]
MHRLQRSFYLRHVTEVARDLLGKELFFRGHRGIIIETEAYRGADDPASHAFKGPTPRSKVMFGPPGYSYVYFIYGMYNCLNIVAEPEGQAAAVLIRGIRLLESPFTKISGPGKLCRKFGITREHNYLDLTTNPEFYLLDAPIPKNIDATPRIGISKNSEISWRFVCDDGMN